MCTSTKPGATTRPSASIVRGARLVDVADLDDPSVADADVGAPARRAGAVDDFAARDQQIEHVRAYGPVATTTRPRECTFRNMKLGLGLDIWAGAGLQMPVEQVREAERLGFDSVWTAEAYGADAITPLAFLAAQTSASGSVPRSCRSRPARRQRPRWRWRPSTRWPAAGA